MPPSKFVLLYTKLQRGKTMYFETGYFEKIGNGIYVVFSLILFIALV